MCDKRDGHHLTFAVGASVGLQVFGNVYTIHVRKPSKLWLCALVFSISGRLRTRTACCVSFPGNKHQAKIGQAYAGISITVSWPRFNVHAICTLHMLLLASPSLLLSRDERNWATVLGRPHRADQWPSQWRLRNRVSPHRMPLEGLQPCVIDADNAAVRLIECTPPSDYDKLNSECQKNLDI